MPVTQQGGRVSLAYRDISIDKQAEYLDRFTEQISLNFNPNNLAGSEADLINSMIGLTSELSSEYLGITQNYINLQVAADLGPAQVIPHPIFEFDQSEIFDAAVLSYVTLVRKFLTDFSIIDKTDKDAQKRRTDLFTNNLAGRGQAAAFTPARQWTTKYAEKNGMRWIRATDLKPCPFCAMLVFHQYGYKSFYTANFKAHNNCGCGAELIPDMKKWSPSKYQEEGRDKFMKEYYDKQNDVKHNIEKGYIVEQGRGRGYALTNRGVLRDNALDIQKTLDRYRGTWDKNARNQKHGFTAFKNIKEAREAIYNGTRHL